MLARYFAPLETYLTTSMFRTLELQAPLQTLMDNPHWGEKIPYFAQADWSLMKKVVLVLQDFHDTTEALSSRSASIAEVESSLSSS